MHPLIRVITLGAVPVSLFYNGNNPLFLLLTCLAILAFGWYSYSTENGLKPVKLASTYLVSGFFFGAIIVAAWFSPHPDEAVQSAFALSILPLSLILFATGRSTSQVWEDLKTALPVLLAVLSAWVIIQHPHIRPTGPLRDPNSMANLLVALALPALVIKYESVAWGRLRWAVLLLTAYAFTLTVSRQATLSLFIVAPFMAWVISRGNKKLMARSLAVFVVAAIGLVAASGSALHKRFNHLGADAPIQARVQMWESSVEMFKQEAGVTGTGPGTWFMYYPAYRQASETESSGGYAHSDYVQLLVELGLPGLASYLALAVFAGWLMLVYMRQDLQSAAVRERAVLSIAAVNLFMMAGVNFVIYNITLSLLMGLYLALALQQVKSDRKPTAAAPRAPRAAVAVAAGLTLWLLGINAVEYSAMAAVTKPAGWLAQTVPGLTDDKLLNTLPGLDSRSAAPAAILVAKNQLWMNHNLKAHKAEMAERFALTLHWYDYALERKPRSAELWYARGAFLMNFGKLKEDDSWIRREAGKSFITALGVSPGDAYSALALANMGLDVKAYGPVLTLLDTSIKSSWDLQSRAKLKEVYAKVTKLKQAEAANEVSAGHGDVAKQD
jgi:O-antigen ligase